MVIILFTHSFIYPLIVYYIVVISLPFISTRMFEKKKNQVMQVRVRKTKGCIVFSLSPLSVLFTFFSRCIILNLPVPIEPLIRCHFTKSAQVFIGYLFKN